MEFYYDYILDIYYYRLVGEADFRELGENEKRIIKFHNAFGVKGEDTPKLIDKETAYLRVKLMQEELDELKEAIDNDDLVEVADALADIDVILNGTFHTFGMLYLKDALSEEVFKSNMSKLDDNGMPVINGEGGYLDERKPLGKILKSKNFVEPNIQSILDKANV